jgi:hypothetical protein
MVGIIVARVNGAARNSGQGAHLRFIDLIMRAPLEVCMATGVHRTAGPLARPNGKPVRASCHHCTGTEMRPGQDDRIDRMRPPGHPVHPVTPSSRSAFDVRCSMFGIAFGLVRPGWLE